MRWHTSSVTPDVPIRVLVIYDRNPENALPLITEILQQDDFLSPMALASGDRFVVLSDVVTPTITGSANGTSTKNGEVYRKINLPAVYSGATGTISDCTQGAVYVMCCFPFTFTPIAGIGYYTRIRYTDV